VKAVGPNGPIGKSRSGFTPSFILFSML